MPRDCGARAYGASGSSRLDKKGRLVLTHTLAVQKQRTGWGNGGGQSAAARKPPARGGGGGVCWGHNHCFSRVPKKGSQSQKWVLPLFLHGGGGQNWAQWLHNLCLLGDPRKKGQKSEVSSKGPKIGHSGDIDPAFL